MLIGIHMQRHGPVDARVMMDIAEKISRRGKERIMHVRIRELPEQDGLPTAVLDVDVFPPRRHDCTINRFVQLQEVSLDDVPGYVFELARREAARNACPIHAAIVRHIQTLAVMSQKLTVDPEIGAAIFLLKSDTHKYAFLAADVQTTDESLAAYFRSFP